MAAVRLARHRWNWLRSGCWLVAGLLSAALAAALARAQEEVPGPAAQQVIDVRIDGAVAIPLERITPQIQTRAGRPLDVRLVEQDVIRLNATRWFVDVKFYYHYVDGGVVVIFKVVERPILQYIKYVGNEKIKEKHLAKRTELRVGAALDPYAVEEGRRKIIELYHERGYPKVDVTIFEGDKTGDRGAVYVIHEGPRQRVGSVKFVGASVTSSGRLKTQIDSKPPILWVFKGYYDRDKVDQDVDKLTAYYRSLGYFRARVGRELDFDKNNKWVTLTFVVDEGPRYAIRNIAFLGNSKVDEEELRAQLKLKPGQFFNQNEMNRDVTAISDLYGGRGYAFVDVQADPRFLEEPGELDLVYNVDEGGRFHVNRINVHINGENPHTKETTVLNRMSIRPGEIFDIREVTASERRLRAAGIFMVEPNTGKVPRIVFSPAETEGSFQADRGSGQRGFRGQSPDPEPRPRTSRYTPQLPAVEPEPPRAVEPEPSQAEFAPRFRPPTNPYGPPRQARDGRPQTLPREAQGESREPVVRGQYTPFGGSRVFEPTARPLPTWPQSQATAPVAQPYPQATAQPTGQVDPQFEYQPPQYAAPSGPQPTVPQSAAPNAYAQPAPVYEPQYQAPNAFAQPVPSYPPQYPPQPAAQGGGIIPRQTIPAPQTSMQGGNPTTPNLVNPNAIYPEDGFPFLQYDEPTRPLDLDVFVDETQTGRLMLGVGVNSDAGLVGSIVLDEQNFDPFRIPTSWADIRNATAFRGAGSRLRIEAVPGNLVQRYMATYQDPYFLDTQYSLGLSGFFFDRRYLEWDEQRLGGRVSFGRQLTPDLTASASIRAESVNIRNPIIPTPPALEDVLGDNDLYIARFQIAHDTRDNPFLATEGHLIELAYEQGFGTFDFPRGSIDARQFFLLRQRADGSGRHVVSLVGRVGITGKNTPIFEKYYAGGFSTLRGFEFRGVTPRVDGVGVGGDFMLLGSAEYLFPLTADDALRGVAFVDFGTVEESVKLQSDTFRVAPGFGLRITIPAMGPAPIALDFAVPIARAAGDDIDNFSFFVGFQR